MKSEQKKDQLLQLIILLKMYQKVLMYLLSILGEESYQETFGRT